MSDLVDIYNRSTKPRPMEAKQIPGLEVNYIDRENRWSVGWTNFQRRGSGTTWTDEALNYFDYISTHLSIPESFNRIESEIPLNRWNSQNSYYKPGQPQG
jgi:hypothetical protein